jgi:hypothetical protein
MGKEKSILEILTEAIAAKKTTKIIYKGGSQPGAVRKILPLKIEGKKLTANCLSSNKPSQIFEMDKVSYAGNLAQSYDTTLDLPLVKCCVCGKKFHGESWQTYCKVCYKKKKRAELDEAREEILNKKPIATAFISALKKNPISENMSLKEKRDTIIEAFFIAIDKHGFMAEALSDAMSLDYRDEVIGKLIEKISDRLPGIPIIRFNKETGKEFLVRPREQILKEAIGTGEAIKVRYYGGTTPGEERELIIREIISDKHVKCFCLRSNLEKTYFLNKIEIEGMSDDDIVDKSSIKSKEKKKNLKWEEMNFKQKILTIAAAVLFALLIVFLIMGEIFKFSIALILIIIVGHSLGNSQKEN